MGWFILIDSVGHIRKHVWHDNEIKRLKLVAEIFSNALARMNSERKLVESTDRLALAAESAEAGLWELDCRTNIFWATEEARRIFGYSSEDIISLMRFEKSIHPEDLATVKQAMSESFANKEKLKVEYRITAGSGAYKWVCSRGRPYYHLDGSGRIMAELSVHSARLPVPLNILRQTN